MVTFILPGYSAKNRQWAEEVVKELELDGQIRPIFWDHWENPEKLFKPKEKARLIAGLAVKNQVNIIAKSVGTLVAAYIIEAISEQINKVILCGIPTVSDERLRIFQKTYKNVKPENVICYQNEGDPFATPAEVKKFMEKVYPHNQNVGVGINPKIKIVSMPGNDHYYPYYEEFQKFLTLQEEIVLQS
ncbi:MAG: hypothetical protein UT61_C0060G0009 [Candidatus Woesebacteria bacterium GW2011_GWA1_39_8]|uniref:Alpha/beta hydrolase n=1 Tax=Candidatus Woesebacteria bacterium GW2011_GWA1_39_8 TaxID=1618552 RepID=A0A0G0PSB5_9BACT|nr:MAG: hypothetical protein UT61_C0060G0009 [Candidatus Woesebacteria bacterium GW2011_GWA1_39_8]